MQNLKIKGFTIIELLITMTIISFLAVLTLAIMPKYVQKAQDSKRLTIINEITTIIRLAAETKIITQFDLDISHQFINNKTGKKIKFHDLLQNTSDFTVPKETSTEYDYVYLYSGKDDFAVLNCSNANRRSLIVKGNSSTLIDELESNVSQICPDNQAPSRNRNDYGENIFGIIITDGQTIMLEN